MSKIVPYDFKYKIYTLKNQTVWFSFEEEPPPPNLRCIFYNKFLDEFRVTTLNKLEEDFKFVRQNFGDLIDESTEDEYVDYYLANTFHPTHWTIAPVSPID
jgi:hypothetical protein